jgi:hypothetical protein
MESHKNIQLDDSIKISLTDNYVDYFKKASEFVNKFYKDDLNRISSTNFNELTPEEFFREYIWCVYTSGFNAKIVSKLFPSLWEVYQPLLKTLMEGELINSEDIIIQSMKICANKRKIMSIVDAANFCGLKIKKLGWSIYRDTELDTPDKLQNLPYVGPITCFHLARNIGLLDYVKPDLHLTRMAKNWNFKSPLDLCKGIQKEYDLPLGIIDLVLWYAASTFGTKKNEN